MLRFPAWKIVSILAMTAFALLLIVPSLMSPDHREALISHLPKWVPARAIVLGLDLQGGSHVLLEVDSNSVVKTLADNLRDTVTVLDHRPLDGLGDEGRLAWLRGRNARWVWNTEGERGPWTAALRQSDHTAWVTAPSQREWGSRNVLRVRFAQLRELFPTLAAPGESSIALTPAQEAARRAFRAGFRLD